LQVIDDVILTVAFDVGTYAFGRQMNDRLGSDEKSAFDFRGSGGDWNCAGVCPPGRCAYAE
ncbi:MAG: hypothetical protein V4702_05130, partial [Patescibacteria group bacterium]